MSIIIIVIIIIIIIIIIIAFGPLLTSWSLSSLLVWTITDIISVITTVVMDLF